MSCITSKEISLILAMLNINRKSYPLLMILLFLKKTVSPTTETFLYLAMIKYVSQIIKISWSSYTWYSWESSTNHMIVGISLPHILGLYLRMKFMHLMIRNKLKKLKRSLFYTFQNEEYLREKDLITITLRVFRFYLMGE